MLQVVTTVDPFGYYAEGIQQKLDDAFVEGEQGPEGTEGSTPLASPSAEPSSRPAESSAFKPAQSLEEQSPEAVPTAEAETPERPQVSSFVWGRQVSSDAVCTSCSSDTSKGMSPTSALLAALARRLKTCIRSDVENKLRQCAAFHVLAA